MKYRLIEAEEAEHSISRLCTVLGVTRQGFHAWRRRGPSLRQLGDAELAKVIVRVYDGSHRSMVRFGSTTSCATSTPSVSAASGSPA
jgi:hypothetical protein